MPINKAPGPSRVFEGAQILFPNFRGLGPPDKLYNPPGNRNFNLVIPTHLVEEMLTEGWNVKCLKPYEEGDEPKCIVEVKVEFEKGRPPIMWMLTSTGRTQLNIDTVGSLDLATFTNIDMIIQGSYWDVNGKQGMKAYLQSFYATIFEDPLALKYAQTPEDLFDEDTPPFDVDPSH